MKFKKALIILSAITCTVSAVPAVMPLSDNICINASAADSTYGSLSYTINDDGYVSITGFDDSTENVVIPDKINGIAVKEIAANAFKDAITLKSIDIPSCVKTIGDCAFQGCVSLKEIVLPESLTSLGIYAFENCTSMKSVWFLFGPTYIPEGCFKNCGALKDVHFSVAVTKFYGKYNIWDWNYNQNSFCGTSIQDVYYAGTYEQWNSVTNNHMAHYSRSIYFEATSARVKSYGNLKYSVVDEHITIMGVDDSAVEVNIPPTIDGLPITRIDEAAFRDASNLEKVTISEGVTEIGGHAFRSCSKLKEVKLPSTLKTIGYASFADCISLPAIDIPTGVTYISDYAFQGCVSLKMLYFPEKLTEVGTYMCENCASLENVYFPNGPSYIPESCFKNCGALKNVYFSVAVTKFYHDYGSDWNKDKHPFEGSPVQDVYYAGSKSQWESVENRNMIPGTLHYNFPVPIKVGSQIIMPELAKLGDINDDGNIDAVDASLILTAYAKKATTGSNGLSSIETKAGDVNTDGNVDAVDASLVLSYYAYTATGGKGSIEEFLS